MAKTRLWIIKAGSQMVCSGGPLLIRSWMRDLEELQRKNNIQVIWVTSGAIATAKIRMKMLNGKKLSLPEKQALSAIGQPAVMDDYNIALQSVGMRGAQVLLTAEDMRIKSCRTNLQNTLNQLLKWNVVPILNENDAVSTDEIHFGDNDSLAARVAIMMKAERLILLTDVDGLYDKDPKSRADAKIISYVKKITIKHLRLANPNNKSQMGTGGMYSKLLAAHKSNKHGIITHLVRGDIPNHFAYIAAKKQIGTQIGGTTSE